MMAALQRDSRCNARPVSCLSSSGVFGRSPRARIGSAFTFRAISISAYETASSLAAPAASARPRCEQHCCAGSTQSPGRYQVEVSKPGYERAVLRDVMAPGDTVCNYAEPTDIRAISLKLLPDAPPVRSIVVLPDVGVVLSPGNTTRFRAVVDAAPRVSRAVRWSSSDTTVATVSPSGLITAGCLPASKDVVITAVSVADPQIRAEGSVWVESPTSLPPPESLIGPGAEEARAR